jgi:hypothetical protein
MSEFKNIINKLQVAIDHSYKVQETEEARLELLSQFDEMELEEAAKWTRAYINSLPDSAFMYIEPGYKEGEDKRARHLPYKDDTGKVDLPHLRNALARCNQIKPVRSGTNMSQMRKTACAKAQKLAKKHLKPRKTKKE